MQHRSRELMKNVKNRYERLRRKLSSSAQSSAKPPAVRSSSDSETL
jgi:hypothetical protein